MAVSHAHPRLLRVTRKYRAQLHTFSNFLWSLLTFICSFHGLSLKDMTGLAIVHLVLKFIGTKHGLGFLCDKQTVEKQQEKSGVHTESAICAAVVGALLMLHLLLWIFFEIIEFPLAICWVLFIVFNLVLPDCLHHFLSLCNTQADMHSTFVPCSSVDVCSAFSFTFTNYSCTCFCLFSSFFSSRFP